MMRPELLETSKNNQMCGHSRTGIGNVNFPGFAPVSVLHSHVVFTTGPQCRENNEHGSRTLRRPRQNVEATLSLFPRRIMVAVESIFRNGCNGPFNHHWARTRVLCLGSKMEARYHEGSGKEMQD